MIEVSKIVYKKFSTPLVKFLKYVGITANQLTIFNIFFMMQGGLCFIVGQYWLGILICGLSAILDYTDGDLAKATTGYTAAGAWIDSFGDIIKQNFIMGSIALGAKIPAWIIVGFFVANAGLNVVSFYYNTTFGFDSYNGSKLFRQYMDRRKTIINRIFKNLIDPTSSFAGLFLYTVRYWILLGVILGMLPLVFKIITVISILKLWFMFVIYSLYLSEFGSLWILKALAVMDKERKEFYEIRK